VLTLGISKRTYLKQKELPLKYGKSSAHLIVNFRATSPKNNGRVRGTQIYNTVKPVFSGISRDLKIFPFKTDFRLIKGPFKAGFTVLLRRGRQSFPWLRIKMRLEGVEKVMITLRACLCPSHTVEESSHPHPH
jgi:hypothetical protein